MKGKSIVYCQLKATYSDLALITLINHMHTTKHFENRRGYLRKCALKKSIIQKEYKKKTRSCQSTKFLSFSLSLCLC